MQMEVEEIKSLLDSAGVPVDQLLEDDFIGAFGQSGPYNYGRFFLLEMAP